MVEPRLEGKRAEPRKVTRTPMAETRKGAPQVDRKADFESQAAALTPKCSEGESGIDASTEDAIMDGLEALDFFSKGLAAQAERITVAVGQQIEQDAELDKADKDTEEAEAKEASAAKKLDAAGTLGLIGDLLSMMTGTKAVFGLIGAIVKGGKLLGEVSSIVGGANAAVGAVARMPKVKPASASSVALDRQLDVITESVKRLGARQIGLEGQLSDLMNGQVRLAISGLGRRLERLAGTTGTQALKATVEQSIAAGHASISTSKTLLDGARQRMLAASRLGSMMVTGSTANRTYLERAIAQKARVEAGEGTAIAIGEVHHRRVELDILDFKILEHGGSVRFDTMLVSTEPSELYNLQGGGPVTKLDGTYWGVPLIGNQQALVSGLFGKETVVRHDLVEVRAGKYMTEVSARIWDDPAARAVWMKQLESWQDHSTRLAKRQGATMGGR
jgi:hypothetical protein